MTVVDTDRAPVVEEVKQFAHNYRLTVLRNNYPKALTPEALKVVWRGHAKDHPEHAEYRDLFFEEVRKPL